MPTYNFSAYNKSLIGFPQSSKAQQAYSVVLTTSFVDRQTAYVPLFFLLGLPICIYVQRFFFTRKNNKGREYKPPIVRIALQNNIT